MTEENKTSILPVKLTEAEKKNIASTAAEDAGLLQDKKAERKEAMAVFKEEIESLEEKIRVGLGKYRVGHEDRPVEVQWFMDTPIKGEKTLRRMDTMETVDTVGMSDADRQLSFPEVA